MSQKRRDNKGRILRNGESQRKDGRYAYKYAGLDGKDKFVYSWKLEKTDRLPAGKRDGLSLREKEKQIQRDLDDGVRHDAGNITVIMLVKQYIELNKKRLKCKSVETYNAVYASLSKESFSNQKINKIKKTDAKRWILKLQEDGRSYQYIVLIKSVMNPAFQMAIDDNIIRENPFDFKLSSIIANDTKQRRALTQFEEERFLNFIKNDKTYSKYYEAIYILFNTGLRISEFTGLTIDDIDFEGNTIDVNHQLLERKIDGGIMIETPKTTTGYRKIPMSTGVKSYLKKILKDRNTPKVEPVVDGKTGFIFLDRNEQPMTGKHWQSFFRRICERYNNVYKDKLKVTPHICRHTFCTKMAKAGMNPKALQYIMGHSKISITLDVYTHMDEHTVKEEFERVNNVRPITG